jgi:hypothetical protein
MPVRDHAVNYRSMFLHTIARQVGVELVFERCREQKKLPASLAEKLATAIDTEMERRRQKDSRPFLVTAKTTNVGAAS